MNRMMQSSPYLPFVGMLLFVIVLAGCREEYKHLAFSADDTTAQAMETDVSVAQSIPADHQAIEQPAPEPGGNQSVPYTYSQLPVFQRETIFNELMGPNSDVYFLQEPGRETFVTFDNDNQMTRMAQAGRIGNRKNSVLILLGVSFPPQETPTIKVYTFETGQNSDIRRYQAGKNSFLQQFQNPRLIGNAKDLQGITGATPIWQPVAEQVRNGYERLLKEKTDAAWMDNIKYHAKIWYRGTPVVQTPDADTDTQAEKPQPDVRQSNSDLMPQTAVLPESATMEAYEFMPDDVLTVETGESDLLYEHWETVAAVEITLFVCGILIVAVSQLKRRVYQ